MPELRVHDEGICMNGKKIVAAVTGTAALVGGLVVLGAQQSTTAPSNAAAAQQSVTDRGGNPRMWDAQWQSDTDPQVHYFPAKADLNGRAGTSLNAQTLVEDAYRMGDNVPVVCQATGETAYGSTIWDKTADGYYVADAYVKTGTDGFADGVPRCEDQGVPFEQRPADPPAPEPAPQPEPPAQPQPPAEPQPANGVRVFPAKTEATIMDGKRADARVVRTVPAGFQVEVVCQAYGGSAAGSNIWNKTTDNLWIPDQQLKTGTDGMVEGMARCDNDQPAGGGSVGGAISRDEVISRGYFWVNQNIPYSMDTNVTYPDPQGKGYRPDCSGFVSMAWRLPSALSTVSLGSVATRIEWEDLQPGDAVGTIGPGTGGAAGHVVLFLRWANAEHTRFVTLEERGGGHGAIQYERAINYPTAGGAFTAKPWRYKNING
ncbi:hypothetical protein [Nakamurella aerolata]|uniref:NlpC/P60 domain-containing protein n=1 Tax=Nakamurella aerolata TaxID=1656892 RepID=A0A849A6R5_9ACTN|nr:hypothetical protein [Nakamurella aerolata]NNG35336.1 hypothetical protein [Nakamurella aerolata]